MTNLLALAGAPTLTAADFDRRMRQVVRELAIDIMEPETILQRFDMTVDEWDSIIQHPQFKEMLLEEKERWNSSLNTKERVEYKTWQILEDALLKFQEYLHSPNFSDTAKVQLLSALQKQVGVGAKDAQAGGSLGERFQITINMGGDTQVRAEHDITPQGNVIEGKAL